MLITRDTGRALVPQEEIKNKNGLHYHRLPVSHLPLRPACLAFLRLRGSRRHWLGRKAGCVKGDRAANTVPSISLLAPLSPSSTPALTCSLPGEAFPEKGPCVRNGCGWQAVVFTLLSARGVQWVTSGYPVHSSRLQIPRVMSEGGISQLPLNAHSVSSARAFPRL